MNDLKWIICNKWFLKKLKPALPDDDEIHYTFIPRWTPLGIAAGIPKSWDSQKKAVNIVKALVNDNPDLKRFLFVVCEVKYVPNEVKGYNQYWYDKYVVTEVKLKITKIKDKGEALFTDESKISIN